MLIRKMFGYLREIVPLMCYAIIVMSLKRTDLVLILHAVN